MTARLKERANDIYESVWQGSGVVAVLNAENALKHPGANEVSVTLVFKTIEYIKLYPSGIVFEPALPVSEITTSTVIPSLKLSVLDQFGNIMTSENGLISVSLENGSFGDSVISKNLVNGAVLFTDLAVAQLIPDSSGYVKLKAVYGSLGSYSQPIKAVGAVIPDASAAGYLTDETSAAASAAFYKLKAPLANKLIKAVCGNNQYNILTGSDGFFRFDVKTDSAEQDVYLEFINSAGAVVKLQITAVKGKTKLANIIIDKNGAARIITSILDIAYDPLSDTSIIKKAVDDEIALKASSGSVAGISGRALDITSDQPIFGASITISGYPELSALTDAMGNFIINAPAGVLIEGDYALTFTAKGFNPVFRNINITSVEYGFVIESIIFEASQKVNYPPSLIIKSITGSSQNISIIFDLYDQEGDVCDISAFYSLNGGYSYISTSNIGGSLSGVTPGSNLNAVWFSASDFLTQEASVKIKLAPRDFRSSGPAVESETFQVDNRIVDPENNPPVIMGVIASGERGDISVKYDLIDQDGDSCAVELYYSSDGGVTYTRSFNYSLNGGRAFPGAGLEIIWNSLSDFQSLEKKIMIKLVPNDSKNAGTAGESNILEINNIINTPPVIQNLNAFGVYKDIKLEYDLIELDGHLCTIEVAYSLDGGLNYLNTINLSGETSSVAAGQFKTLTWFSYNDFSITNKNVFVKLTPSDKYGYGTGAIFGPLEIINGGGRPEIKNMAVSGASQIIDVTYDLFDIDASPATIEVYYSRDGGLTFNLTGQIEGDIHAVMPGTNKTIKWNSYGDFHTSEKNVILKLLPIDDSGAGTESVSLPFEINNNVNRPFISNLMVGVDSGEVLITYDIDDADGSACQIEFQYATEASGGYINSMYVTGETAEVFPGPAKTLLWHSKNDFTKNYDSVSVKLIASDGKGSGVEAVSGPFKVYNNSSCEVFINTITGNSHDITLDYNLHDAEGDSFAVALYYSRDGGSSFTATSNISGDILNILPADNLKLIWHSAKDMFNQNAVVILKIAALDQNGMIQSEAVSQSFNVINYVPPPVIVPSLQKAEMISDTKLALTFSTAVTVADKQTALTKISVNGYNFNPAYDSMEVSSNIIQIKGLSSSFISLFMIAQSSGITVDESNEGLKFQSGNGIKSSTGTEVAVNSTGFNILADVTPPDPLTENNLSAIWYSNADLSVNSSANIIFSENSYFQVYTGSTPPGANTTPLKVTESSTYGIISGTPILEYLSLQQAGNTVYYRLSDRAGNSNEWQADGVIPEAPPAETLTWSNAALKAFNASLTDTIGAEGDILKVYENMSVITNYCASASSAAPAGGYPADSAIQCSGSLITNNYSVYYTLVNQSGNESDYTVGGMVPGPPDKALVASKLKLRYNDTFSNNGNYEIYNNDNANISLTASLRIIIDDGVDKIVIGRTNGGITIASGSYAGAEGYNNFESLNANGLKTSMTAGGILKFSYVNDDNGNESSYISDNTTPGFTDYVPPRPDYNNFRPAGVNLKILNSSTGTSKDKVRLYEKTSGGVYTFKVNTSDSGPFEVGTDDYELSSSFVVAPNGSASYTFVGFDSGNESVISNDTIHIAGVLDYFELALESSKVYDTIIDFNGVNTLTAMDYYSQPVLAFDASSNNVTLSVIDGADGTITGLGSDEDNVLNQFEDFINGVCDLSGKLKFTPAGYHYSTVIQAVSTNSKIGIDSVIFSLP